MSVVVAMHQMIAEFDCEKCGEPTTITFFGPVPKYHREVCPRCWIPESERKSVERFKAALARSAPVPKRRRRSIPEPPPQPPPKRRKRRPPPDPTNEPDTGLLGPPVRRKRRMVKS